MNTPMPCGFSSDLRRFERDESDQERATVSMLDEANEEFLTGSCRPFTPENIAEALANLVHEPRAELLMRDLAFNASVGDIATFSQLLLTSIEAYWQRQSLRVVQRRPS